jgi:hypothetical protein
LAAEEGVGDIKTSTKATASFKSGSFAKNSIGHGTNTVDLADLVAPIPHPRIPYVADRLPLGDLRAPFSRRNHRWLTAAIRIPATFGRRDESVTTSQ